MLQADINGIIGVHIPVRFVYVFKMYYLSIIIYSEWSNVINTPSLNSYFVRNEFTKESTLFRQGIYIDRDFSS